MELNSERNEGRLRAGAGGFFHSEVTGSIALLACTVLALAWANSRWADDGHTILFAQNSALTIRTVLDPQSVGYDALRDLVPLGITSRTPSILVVRSDAPYRNFAELIEYSKKKPDQV
ncbi:MAG TPA: tripartite tricarboxylate transporter substrate-binding protein, partial [Burkholderiales bacterium]|nr:tripartite tricarboxylate transporter substrate-binding protein [Burkholderiales bacterium]